MQWMAVLFLVGLCILIVVLAVNSLLLQKKAVYADIECKEYVPSTTEPIVMHYSHDFMTGYDEGFVPERHMIHLMTRNGDNVSVGVTKVKFDRYIVGEELVLIHKRTRVFKTIIPIELKHPVC